MTLLLTAGAGWGFWRFRDDTRRAVLGLLFWGVVITLAAAAYSALS